MPRAGRGGDGHINDRNKMLERQDNMVLGFVGIEKAFDTVPREMVLTTVVLEVEAMMV